MSKTVCIYSQERDGSTDFLKPLYDHICTTLSADGVGYDADSEEDTISRIYDATKDADTIIFLGHGNSKGLYACVQDNFELFNQKNVAMLTDKSLFLLACRSSDFIKRFSLTNAIGFGHLPTSNEDAKHWNNEHSIALNDFSKDDIKLYDNAIVSILYNAIAPETISNSNLLYNRIKLQASMEIVKCLILHKDNPHYRKIADLLFYLQKDIRIQ
ncbi:MAG: hypothetical protein IKZ99_11985 [Salinivirgaceae bacterium]|nr:hypothetical protein [Salinivirgaceae bacterium]